MADECAHRINRRYCPVPVMSMWHRWLNFNFAKLRECFLCAKKTKITIYSTILSRSYCLPPFWRVARCMCTLSPERNQRCLCSGENARMLNVSSADYIDCMGTLQLRAVRASESSQILSKISYFVFRRWTKILQVWNDMRVCQNLHFGVNYPFKKAHKHVSVTVHIYEIST